MHLSIHSSSLPLRRLRGLSEGSQDASGSACHLDGDMPAIHYRKIPLVCGRPAFCSSWLPPPNPPNGRDPVGPLADLQALLVQLWLLVPILFTVTCFAVDLFFNQYPLFLFQRLRRCSSLSFLIFFLRPNRCVVRLPLAAV